MTPLEAARTSMDEVAGALVAIVLVLCAVFVPTLFLNGLSGAFYQQFAVTISAATVISLLVSLTLSPALAAMLLQAAQRTRCPPTACVGTGAARGRSLQPRVRAVQRALCAADPPAGRDARSG